MSNDTLLREVDEDLRRDRVRSLWRRSAPFVIGAAVAVVLLVAGYEGWSWWTESNAAKSSDQFYAAANIAEGTDFEAAKKALDGVIAEGLGAYPVLAQFRQASLLAQQGKIDEAVAQYDALSTSVQNPHLREMALIMGANLLVDNGDVAAVQQRVQGSISPNSPLRNAAREVLGLVQYKAGQLDAAMTTFQEILADPLASRDLQSLVQIFVQQLLSEGAAPVVADTPVETPVAPSAEASSEAAVSAVSSESSAEVSSSAP